MSVQQQDNKMCASQGGLEFSVQILKNKSPSRPLSLTSSREATLNDSGVLDGILWTGRKNAAEIKAQKLERRPTNTDSTQSQIDSIKGH